jgi:hypothetical protein
VLGFQLDLADDAALREATAKRFSAVTAEMKERDKMDRRLEKERLRATKQERKRKLKERAEHDYDQGPPVLRSRGEELSESHDEPSVPMERHKQAKTPTTASDLEALAQSLIQSRA